MLLLASTSLLSRVPGYPLHRALGFVLWLFDEHVLLVCFCVLHYFIVASVVLALVCLFPTGVVFHDLSLAYAVLLTLECPFPYSSNLVAVAVRALALFGTAVLCHRTTMRQAESAVSSSVSPPSSNNNNEGNTSSGGGGGSIDSSDIPISFNFSLDEEWIVYLFDSFPSLVFCSAVSLVVLFWARIYYAANLVAYPLFS